MLVKLPTVFPCRNLTIYVIYYRKTADVWGTNAFHILHFNHIAGSFCTSNFHVRKISGSHITVNLNYRYNLEAIKSTYIIPLSLTMFTCVYDVFLCNDATSGCLTQKGPQYYRRRNNAARRDQRDTSYLPLKVLVCCMTLTDLCR